MATIVSFNKTHAPTKPCAVPFSSLFQKTHAVLVGCGFDVFFAAALGVMPPKPEPESVYQRVCREDTLYEKKIALTALVHAAAERGMKHLLLCVAPSQQKTVDHIVSIAQDILKKAMDPQKISLRVENYSLHFLNSRQIPPLACLIQAAAFQNMAVHAVSLTPAYIASLLYHTQYTHVSCDVERKARLSMYKMNYWAQDIQTLSTQRGVPITTAEKEMIFSYIKPLLSDNRQAHEVACFDESATLQEIQKITGGEPFLCIAQNYRLFSSDEKNLSGLIRSANKGKKIITCSATPETRWPFPQKPQYHLYYAPANCLARRPTNS